MLSNGSSAAARLKRRVKLEKTPSKRESYLKNRLNSAVGCSDLSGGASFACLKLTPKPKAYKFLRMLSSLFDLRLGVATAGRANPAAATTVHFLQSPRASFALHSLQSSPAVGLVVLLSTLAPVGYLEQFLHQCHVSLPFRLRYSAIILTSSL